MIASQGITELLIDWNNGNEEVQEELFRLVEAELKRQAHFFMRRLNPGDDWQTNALINEAYIRIADQSKIQWQNRAHFFGIAARMMRRILLNHIRAQNCVKRGGNDNIQVSMSETLMLSDEKSREILALEEALCHLEILDERKVRVVELRYYGGLSIDETADFLKISKITVIRDWNMAKAWLAREIKDE